MQPTLESQCQCSLKQFTSTYPAFTNEILQPARSSNQQVTSTGHFTKLMLHTDTTIYLNRVNTCVP